MPELPDVECFKRYVEKEKSFTKKVKKVRTDKSRVVKSPAKIRKIVEGERILNAERIGKNLFFETKKGALALHFGMTGYLQWFSEEKPEHTHLSIEFSGGKSLAFVNPRQFGKAEPVQSREQYLKRKKIGKDALAMEKKEFLEYSSSTATIKSFLMNQKKFSGIGNIYSDEILYQAGVSPKKKTNELEEREKERVFEEMKKVLKKAIEKNVDEGMMPKHFLLRRRENGEECGKCGGKIKNEKVAGRSAYYCPKHQK